MALSALHALWDRASSTVVDSVRSGSSAALDRLGGVPAKVEGAVHDTVDFVDGLFDDPRPEKLSPNAPPPFVHSHNDYLRQHPLDDALSSHANSVEADVHLASGKLLVGHDRSSALSGRHSLEDEYLRPLQQKVQAHGGRLPGGPLTLMVELKSQDHGDSSPQRQYAVLKPLLEKYRGMLTSYDGSGEHAGAVSVVLTGSGVGALRQQLAAEPVRLAALDGSVSSLKGPVDPLMTPQVSGDWSQVLHGLSPSQQRQKLGQLAQQARQDGVRLRLWGGPDNPAAWSQEVNAGAEVNTDDPIGFRRWFDATRTGRNAPS